MSYCVTTTTNNGYRCGCCHRSWTDTEWYDDLEAAEENIPDTLLGNGDYEVEEVEIKDGTTGEVVSWGRLSTTSGHFKYSGYRYSCWSGWKNGAAFEVITNQQGTVITDKTWDECQAEVKAEGDRQKRAKAEAEIKRAQAVLDSLSS